MLPALGAIEVRKLDDRALRNALRAVGRGRGRGRTADRLLAEVSQMFRWAEKRKPWRALLVEGNPAELIALRTVVPPSHALAIRDRVLSPDELVELRDRFQQAHSAYITASDRRAAPRPLRRETQLALWICLSTGCRIGELLKARWDQVNLEAGHWHVPAADTKTKVAWDVFLSNFARRQFEALHVLTGDSPWCFPARDRCEPVDVKTVSKQIGDRQTRFKSRRPLKGRRNDDTLVLGGGTHGEWTPHDLRRTAATMMQRLGVTPDVIDRCQNHVLAGSKVRRHYLHHDYAQEKRDAWQRLGAELERILEASNTSGRLT